VPSRSVQGLSAGADCGLPQLSGRRLLREVRALGYDGGYTAITDFLRTVRPPATLPFEVRFETPPGRQAQVDFAQFQVAFTPELALACRFSTRI
jgi:transposase